MTPAASVINLLRVLDAHPEAIATLRGRPARHSAVHGPLPFEVRGEDIERLGQSDLHELSEDRRRRPAHAGRCGRSRSDASSCTGARSVHRRSCSRPPSRCHTCLLTAAGIARPESHDFDAGVAAPVGFAPAAVRRAVSSWVLGGGAEVGVGRTARAGVGAAPAGIAGRAACFAAGALFGCACSDVGVRGAFAFASAGRLPPRARRGGRLGSWRSSPSLTRRPTSCPMVMRGSTCESSPRSCSSPCWHSASMVAFSS